MERPNLQKLTDKNVRAANEMVTTLAAAYIAGNEDMSVLTAGNRALETAEYILTRIVPTEKDEDDGDMESEDDS